MYQIENAVNEIKSDIFYLYRGAQKKITIIFQEKSCSVVKI